MPDSVQRPTIVFPTNHMGIEKDISRNDSNIIDEIVRKVIMYSNVKCGRNYAAEKHQN